MSEFVLESHHERWAAEYEQEASLIRPLFGDALITIEHIGSTAVAGLVAKPVIDLVALIREKQTADSVIRPLARLGYADHSQGSAERHFFTKGPPTRFHLSIAYADFSRFFERQVLLRDYLRQHPEAQDEYGDLKARLMSENPGQDVSAGKTAFIMRCLIAAGFDPNQGW